MKCKLAMALSVCVMLTACGQQSDSQRRMHSSPYEVTPTESIVQQAQEILSHTEMTRAGIEGIFKDEKQMTPAEYTAFLYTFESCRFMEDGRIDLDNCPALNLVFSDTVRKHDIHPAARAQVIEHFIKSDNPILRAAAFMQVSGSEPISFFDPLLKAAKDEKDNNAIVPAYAALQTYITDNYEYTQQANDLFSAAASSPLSRIRHITAQTFGFKSVAQNHPEHLDALIKMFNDPDLAVRSAAISSSATYNDNKVVPYLSAILADPNQASLHADAVHALNKLWLDYPLHQNHSDEAYKAFTIYLTSNFSQNLPAPGTLDDLTLINTSSSAYTAWLAEATYFNAEELIAMLKCIASNNNIARPIQEASAKAIHAFGGTFSFDEIPAPPVAPSPIQNKIASVDLPHDQH